MHERRVDFPHRDPLRASISRIAQSAVFFLLVVTAACLPFSIKGSERSWRLAFLLWLLQLTLSRKRPVPQPLAAPLLAFVVLSGISTALSSEPYLSWDRMKIVCMLLLAVLVGQTLTSLRQVRLLTTLTVLSGVAAVGFTAWQYSYGIGVRINKISAETPLFRAGLIDDRVITRVNGHPVRTPEQLKQLLRRLPANTVVPVDFLREPPATKMRTYVTPQAFIDSGLHTETLQLSRATPSRAQGTLGHYIVFAEILMQLGCIAFGLALADRGRSLAGVVGWSLAVVAFALAIVTTQTRAALIGLAIGCFTAAFTVTRRRSVRLLAVALLVLALGTALYVQRKRNINGSGASDTGTQFRALMWEDGIRLAREHPWFGVGMETVHVHWPEWNIRAFAIYHVQSHFHSTYLQIAVERGIPALLAWIWFLCAYLFFLVRLVRHLASQHSFCAGVIAGVLAGITAFACTGLFHYNLGEEQLSLALYFFVGIALATDRLSREELSTKPA